jgi:two-component system, chemotaxis family, chemotaxis protein CheY
LCDETAAREFEAHGMQILIVDADRAVRDYVRSLLSRAGDDVEEAVDGTAGLEAYRRKPADVVFVDSQMPDMDGLKFTRHLLMEFPGARVVMMAGPRRHGAPDPLAMAKTLGARETLRKPFDSAEAFRILHEALE